MVFYVLDREEVDHLLQQLKYLVPSDYIQRNLDYYFKRTSHGSTLSRIVHAKLALIAGNAELSWKLYSEALASDFNDIQGGTTGEGIHAGVMGGTIVIAMSAYAGINTNGPVLHLDPALPQAWESIACQVKFKSVTYTIEVDKSAIRVTASEPTQILIRGHLYDLTAGQATAIQY